MQFYLNEINSKTYKLPDYPNGLTKKQLKYQLQQFLTIESSKMLSLQ